MDFYVVQLVMALVKALAMALAKALVVALVVHLFSVGAVQFKDSTCNLKVNILADLYHQLQHG
jgi:hypothetical protein